MADLTADSDIDAFMVATTVAGMRAALSLDTGNSPTFTTATLSGASSLLLGTSGSLVGSVGFRNATSGTATVAPPTGALGTYQVTLPNAASILPIFGQQVTFAGPTAARTYTLPDAAATLARTDAANTFTGTQVFTGTLTAGVASSSDGNLILLNGSNNNSVTYAAGSPSGDLTLSPPATTGLKTLAVINAAQAWTGVQTMTSPSFTTSVVTGSSTLAVFNTTATTVNAFGATTSLNIGAAAALVLNFGGHTAAAEFRFLEPSGSGTNFIGFIAAAMAASTTYVWPTVAATGGQVLRAKSATPTELEFVDPSAASVDEGADYTWTGTHDFSGAAVALGTIAMPLTLGTAGSIVGQVDFKNATSGTLSLIPATGALGTVSLTLPAATDTLVGKATTDTLTNKTLTAPVLNSATVGTKISPTTDDGAPLGDTTHNFSDLFLASGAVINIANGNWVATHTSAILTVGTGDLRVTTAGTNSASVVTVGGAQTLTSKVLTAATITTSLVPTTDDGAALGDTTHNFSDVFLATGAVINVANGNAVITHSSGIFTVSTGDWRVTTAGTNSASVVTVGGTQTLTAKTLTSPTTNTPTFGGLLTFAENASNHLVSVLSADGKYTGTTMPGVAGAALAFGDLIVMDVTDSRWELADSNSAAAADGDCRGLIGICVLAAAADGDPTIILIHGTVRADTAFPTLTVTAPVYVSETAGDVTSTAPVTTDAVIRVIGWAITADSMLFQPTGAWTTHT